MSEPLIRINGKLITEAQAMALRVAVTAFHDDMIHPEALGDDEHGMAMTRAYRDRLTEVLKMMLGEEL